MNYRLPLTLVLLVGCNPSPNIDLGESDSAQSGTQGTAGSTGANTGEVPTGSGSGGSQTSSEQSGSQSASQSGSETTEDTAVTGTSGSSGADDTTSGSSSTGSTGSTGQVDTSTGGGCMPKIGGPAAVVLGDSDDLAAAGAYAVLAKTAITSVPKTAIAGGHVGISPAAASDMTGFALVLDPTGVFATSKQVVAPGRVYAADYTVPTPVNLTT